LNISIEFLLTSTFSRMENINFVPLELWRASSLSTETKQVIAAYERLLAASDFDGLLTLRTSIEVSSLYTTTYMKREVRSTIV
jgi:hypothetical protein